MNIEKLAALEEMCQPDIELLRRKILEGKDKNGSIANNLANTYRLLGVADYLLRQDIKGFKEKLSAAAELRSSLFSRFDAGEDISPSYVSMISYMALLDALAAQNIIVSQRLASQMGGRDELEKVHDRDFEMSMGYSLKYIIASEYDKAAIWIERLESACDAAEKDFSGVPIIFKSICDADVRGLEEGFFIFSKGFKKQCKGKGLFRGTEDEVLCLWAVAFGNLAINKNLELRSVSGLAPTELLAYK
jgi:hypothetical protein